jgi:hypothetical protein
MHDRKVDDYAAPVYGSDGWQVRVSAPRPRILNSAETLADFQSTSDFSQALIQHVLLVFGPFV